MIQSQALQNLEVQGAEYPPPAQRVQYAKMVFYVQIGLFALVLFGTQLCKALNMAPPGILSWGSLDYSGHVVADDAGYARPFAVFMMIWLLGNTIQSNLLSTQAFEIHHGNELIWSSLEQKHVPEMADVIRAFGKTGVEFMQTGSD